MKIYCDDCGCTVSAEDAEDLLRACASKLESQVVRNPDLPKSYADLVKEVFEFLNR